MGAILKGLATWLLAIFVLHFVTSALADTSSLKIRVLPHEGIYAYDTNVHFSAEVHGEGYGVPTGTVDIIEGFGKHLRVCSTSLTPQIASHFAFAKCVTILSPSDDNTGSKERFYKIVYYGDSVFDGSEEQLSLHFAARLNQKRQTIDPTATTDTPIDTATTDTPVDTATTDTPIDTATTDTPIDTSTTLPLDTTDIPTDAPTVDPGVISGVSDNISNTSPTDYAAVDQLSQTLNDLLLNPGLNETGDLIWCSNLPLLTLHFFFFLVSSWVDYA